MLNVVKTTGKTTREYRSIAVARRTYGFCAAAAAGVDAVVLGWMICSSVSTFTGTCRVKANLHRRARHDKTVLSALRPLQWCQLDSRQLKTVAERKFEAWTRSEQSSNSHRHTRHDTDRTVLSCLVWRCELSISKHRTLRHCAVCALTNADEPARLYLNCTVKLTIVCSMVSWSTRNMYFTQTVYWILAASKGWIKHTHTHTSPVSNRTRANLQSPLPAAWQQNSTHKNSITYTHTHTHTHTRLTAFCPGLPGWAGTRKAKPIWISLKQETASGSGISWAICKSAPRCRQVTTPAPHHSVFLQAGCPSCRPTNSVKALKANSIT